MVARSRFRPVCRSAVLAAGFAAAALACAADRVVFQVTEADPGKWNMVLNNVRNLQKAADADSEIEVVAYGPGITQLKADSPFAAQITELVDRKVKVVVCQNTMAGMKLVAADMLGNVGYVPAGVVEVMRKQQQGWAYIRP